ncbi:MAG: zinc dependent phospholipase C family protein [Peptococcaceae bacterium]|nr:zinc dependent phospholipase C family protein [Peptococcaceae bacterium]
MQGWKKAYWAGARALLAATGPLQNLVDPPGVTHLFINQQALGILRDDGLTKQAEFLGLHLGWMQRGVSWADAGWKNVAHYFDPESGRGMQLWPGAAGECDRYFGRAAACWRRGRLDRSLFYLGAAVHLVQDLCVPYHSGRVPFNGHQVFEKWAEEHRLGFRAAEGIYRRAPDPSGWVRANAMESYAYLPELLARGDREAFHRVTGVMLPLAQATTAGFLAFFLEQVAW